MNETYYVRIPADASGNRGRDVSGNYGRDASGNRGSSGAAGEILVPVTVSDEPWKGDLAVTGPEAVTPRRLTDAARRKVGLPLIIAETEHLTLREFAAEDLPAIREMSIEETELKLLGASAGQFCSEEFLRSYIRNQYPVWGFGMWGVFLRETGTLIGMAGFALPEEETPPGPLSGPAAMDESALSGPAAAEEILAPSLGYYIAPEYRRRGFAAEACRAALLYAAEELGLEESGIEIRIRKENRASRALAEKLAGDGIFLYSGQELDYNYIVYKIHVKNRKIADQECTENGEGRP